MLYSSFFALFLFLNSNSARAVELEEMGTSHHSFQSLGDQFSTAVPVNKIEDGKLVLFNFDAAKRLGINLPKDPVELEKSILKQWGYMVDPTHQANENRMATYYLDKGVSKTSGEAIGDGRALWLGEIAYQDAQGKKVYLDVVAKGTGVTPLAPKKSSFHSDGLQSMDEAVSSFVLSEANNRNALETTTDLAVIKIPQRKKSKYFVGQTTDSAITIRVGPQFRLAHLHYHVDNPKNFTKIANYLINRELGRNLSSSVSRDDIMTYLKNFSQKIGEQSAQYTELHAVHGSPTPSNRTIGGVTIDMGTFRYLDANHSEYSFLFDQYKLEKQNHLFFNYIDTLIDDMKTANYFTELSAKDVSNLKNLAQQTQNTKLTELYLERIGLTQKEINLLKPNTKNNFLNSINALLSEQSQSSIQLKDKSIKPAAYDIRAICEKAMDIMTIQNSEQRSWQWKKLFFEQRRWASPNRAQGEKLINQFEASLKQIVSDVNPGHQIDLNWIDRAKNMNAHRRPIADVNTFSGNDKYNLYQSLLDQITEGRRDYVTLSKEALRTADTFTDSPVSSLSRSEFNFATRKDCLNNTLWQLLVP